MFWKDFLDQIRYVLLFFPLLKTTINNVTVVDREMFTNDVMLSKLSTCSLDLVPATWDTEPQSAIGIRLEKSYITSFHLELTLLA